MQRVFSRLQKEYQNLADRASALLQDFGQFLDLRFQQFFLSAIYHQAMVSHEAHFVVVNRYQ